MEPLNSREVKVIVKMLEAQWGFAEKFPYAMLQSSKDRLYLLTPTIAEVDLSALNIDAAGLYFGELRKGQIRLSIEGSQLIGPKATKNIANIDAGTMRQWLKGEDIPWSGPGEGFLLIQCNGDFLGTGKYQPDEGKILNFVPKARRILAND